MKTQLCLFFSLLFSFNGYAQCELKTKRITVFKDATAFVELEGKCQVSDHQTELTLPSNQDKYVAVNRIILGTLEIEARDNKIVTQQSILTPSIGVPLKSIDELFEKNIGLLIRIKLKEGDELTGEIFALDEEKGSRYNTIIGEKILILKNEERWSFVKIADIRDFQFLSKPQLQKPSSKRSLQLTFDKDKSQQAIKLSYLRKGITWIPNYIITLKDNNKLRLNLKAKVINDTEDMDQIDLNLAVGVPTFKYSTMDSPLISNISVLNFIKNMTNLESKSNKITRNSGLSQLDIAPRETNTSNGKYPIVKGDTKNDIFLYKLKSVSMKKGERSSFDITSLECSYEDIFTVNLGTNNFMHSNNYKPQNTHNIWHTLKFDNTSGLPLSTGPAFFKKVSNKNNLITPISQGRLNYTPYGETCYLKMSVTPNVSIQDSDEVISKENAPSFYYSVVKKIQGEIKVTNFKNEKLKLQINRDIACAELTKSSENWSVINTQYQLFQYNQVYKVLWDLEVEPGQTKVITYEYVIHSNR